MASIMIIVDRLNLPSHDKISRHLLSVSSDNELVLVDRASVWKMRACSLFR